MNEAIINRYVHHATEKYLKRTIDDAYWMGAAIGMAAGAVLGVMVGLIW
jgi:ElaB/YqjD/DUF883 family membrane-anchored ribosome-binding protein